jgi:hypothetical protein
MLTTFSPATTRQIRLILFGAAVVGLLIGVNNLILHITSDPLADVRAYYDAGLRLNSGRPLYVQPSDTNAPEFYRYPPLLAIVFRPLALLPYELAAAVWEAFVIGCFVFSVWRLGKSESTLLALGILAMPIVWTIVIGQAQMAVTALLLVGSPAAVALAANLKLLPILVALYWVGRRDWRALGWLAAWMAILGGVQLVLEPTGTLAFLTFTNITQVGQVNNISLFAVSPAMWVALVVVLVVVALRLAPTKWGWAAAVALSVLATPRLLSYQLSSLLAGLRRPE